MTELKPEDLRDLVVAAYLAGAEAVHANYQPDPDPEFGEAALDYVASLPNETWELLYRRAERPSPPMAEDLEREADGQETYEIGKRDGYQEAVQEIDVLTGGDGEYRFCTDGDPDRHTPDPPAMIARIAGRFEALSSLAGWRPMATAPQDRLIEFYAPPAHGLDALVGLVSWHPDGGFCVCELREPTHWRPHHPPGAA